MRIGRAFAVVCVAAIAIVGAGCGGDKSTASPTVEWAEGFCTAVTSWTDELDRIGEDLQDPSSLSIDALKQAAGDVSAATDAFVEDVRALGAPETESGQEVQDSLESLADTIDAEKTEIEDAAEGVSGLTDLPSAITSITTAFASMGTAFASTLQTIESGDAKGELEDAFQQADSCDEIAGSSTG